MTIAQTQNTAEQLLRDAGILPVVTVDTLDQARRVADALLEGGLPAIELTLRTPIAIEALAMLKRELPNIVIGAGTVLSELQLRQSVDAGADFLVTPAPRRRWRACSPMRRFPQCLARPRRPSC